MTTHEDPNSRSPVLGGVRFNKDGTYDFVDDDSTGEGLLATIKEFAHWHHLNSMVVAQGGTPSDSEIDFEVIAWNTIKRALGSESKSTPTVSHEIIDLLVAGKSFVFDPSTRSFHVDDYDVAGALTYEYEPTSWNRGMDGFDMEAARIGRAAFERVIDLDLVSDTSEDPDEIIDALALLDVNQERAESLRQAERVLPNDWTVSDTKTAGLILAYLGHDQDESTYPGADRRRDKIAAMIRARIDATIPAEDLVERLASSLAVFTRHYESWMDEWKDTETTSTYSRHTFGDLRNAIKLVDEANGVSHGQTKHDDPRVMEVVKALQKSRHEARILDVQTAKRILSTLPAGTEKSK